MGVQELAAISNRYGGDKNYVLAGGGNTSLKEGDVMYVKASGTTLADVDAAGFARMDLEKLKEILTREYPQESEAREAQALGDLMSARVPGETRRPSVETLLHALLPYRYVIHTHPALVNGLTCSVRGEAAAAEIFGKESLWVPVVNPGYILAKVVRDMLEEHRRNEGGDRIIFLQNHGVFIQGDTPDEIDSLYEKVMGALYARLDRHPVDTFDIPQSVSPDHVKSLLLPVVEPGEIHVAGAVNDDLRKLLATEESFAPLELSFTPDHIVYCGFKPLFCSSAEELADSFRAFTEQYGAPPKVIALKGAGIFAVGATRKAAELARDVFLDGVRIAVYSESFGGHSFMPRDKIDFIRNWEVEQYRSSISGS